jgi:hypothetical protein
VVVVVGDGIEVVVVAVACVDGRLVASVSDGPLGWVALERRSDLSPLVSVIT